ncbi:MAG: type II secretion system F family protein [Magnetococcales bacterium]|nr:type II secretion system F family protein [Magnetococcales bacterium]
MAFFIYRLISREGRVQGGLTDLPFDNPISAMTYLEGEGNTVLYAQPLPGAVGGTLAFLDQLFEHKVKAMDVAEVLNNVAMMLKSGIPLVSALEDTLIKHDNPTLIKVGRDVVQRIKSGSSLSQAMSRWPRFFPDTAIFLIRIGEETGTLDRTVQDASAHIVKMDRIIRETKRALTYPAVMLSAIFTAAAFWLYFVVPLMVGLLSTLDKDLPALTRGILAASNFLQNNLIGVILFLVVLVVGFKISLKKSQWFRRRFHGFLLAMPPINKILHTSNLAFITEYFSVLLNAGVDAMKSLDVLRGSVSNELYRERIGVVRESLVKGVGLRQAFTDGAVFPPLVVRLIGVGEQSGRLDEQLRFAAEEYGNRLDSMIATLSKVIEPVALVIGGILFLTLLVGMLLPLYTMG